MGISRKLGAAMVWRMLRLKTPRRVPAAGKALQIQEGTLVGMLPWRMLRLKTPGSRLWGRHCKFKKERW